MEIFHEMELWCAVLYPWQGCVRVCMRDSVCQPALSGCGSCMYWSVTDSWWEFSDSRSKCWPLFQRKTSKRRHCSLMGSRLIRPTLIPIITCTELSSDSQCNSLVLCRQSPSQKGDLQYEGNCALGVYYLLDWFWLSACEVCRSDGCRVCIHNELFYLISENLLNLLRIGIWCMWLVVTGLNLIWPLPMTYMAKWYFKSILWRLQCE